MGWPDERHHQKISYLPKWPVSSRAGIQWAERWGDIECQFPGVRYIDSSSFTKNKTSIVLGDWVT